MPPTNGAAVTLPVGDPLMARTATEYRRLIDIRNSIDDELAKRSDTLRQGLAERRKTRMEIGGLSIHVPGNSNTVIVSVIDRRTNTNLRHSA